MLGRFRFDMEILLGPCGGHFGDLIQSVLEALVAQVGFTLIGHLVELR